MLINTDFLRFAIPPKLIILIKTVKESHSAIHNASFGIIKVKIGQLLSLQLMFEFPWKVLFCSILNQNGPIFDISRNLQDY